MNVSLKKKSGVFFGKAITDVGKVKIQIGCYEYELVFIQARLEITVTREMEDENTQFTLERIPNSNRFAIQIGPGEPPSPPT